MGEELKRSLADVALWVIIIMGNGALYGAGLVEHPAISLASVALWLGLRARSKPDVNTAHTNKKSEI